MGNNIKDWNEFLKDVPSDALTAELERRKENKNSNLSPLAKEFMSEIDDALESFGSYTYGDKGPDEVMDLRSLVGKLKALPSVKDMASVLSEILDNYPLPTSKGNKYNGVALVQALIYSLDDLPESDFDELFTYDDRFEY